MPDYTRANCRTDRGGCGKNAREVGPISWTGLCGRCAVEIRERANDEMHYHRGPTFEKWRQRMAACVGAALLDDRENAA